MRYAQFREFTDGDAFFSGVDSTRDRSVLKPGIMPVAQNGRCNTASYDQREGTTFPLDFNPAFENSFVGSGVYRDPNGDEALMIACRNGTQAWALRYGKDPVAIIYKAGTVGTNGTGGVNFAQAFDKLILLRFPVQGGAKLLSWNGNYDQTNTSNQWNEFTVNGVDPGVTLPPPWNAEPFMDRLIYYNQNYIAVGGRDNWTLSDINDYTTYDDVYQVGRTNSGESDFITRIKAYYHGAFIVYKTQSIHMVTLLPVYPVEFEQRILSVTLGSYGNHMPLEIGGDMIFLSNPGGFYRLAEVVQDSITTLPVAISEPIQETIDTFQWGATGIFGCSASLDNYAFFGVAIGTSATRCNAILVFNTQTNHWESVPDTWADPTFGFNALHVTNYNNVRRVFALDYDNSVVYLLYEGLGDDLKTGFWSVPFKMETRGYIGENPFTFKRFLRSSVTISTYNPSINLTAISSGYNNEKLLTPVPITKDRTKYYTEGKADFNSLTDDPNQPMRQDYSVADAENVAIEDFENLPDGPINLIPPTTFGVSGPEQETTERRLIRQTGRWISLRIENSQGACTVLATSVEGTETMNNIRVAA